MTSTTTATGRPNDVLVAISQYVDEVQLWADWPNRPPGKDAQWLRELRAEHQWAGFPLKQPIRSAVEDGFNHIRLALDFLLGAASAINSADAQFAAIASIRCSIESAAYGAWLLDSSVDGSERVRRGFREHAWAYQEFLRMHAATASGSSDAEDTVVMMTRLENLLEWAEYRDLLASSSGSALKRHVGRPGATDRVSGHFKKLRGDAGVLQGHGEGVYRLMCGFIHGNQLVVTQHIRPTGPAKFVRGGGFQFELDFCVAVHWLAVATVAVGAAVHELGAYASWSDDKGAATACDVAIDSLITIETAARSRH